MDLERQSSGFADPQGLGRSGVDYDAISFFLNPSLCANTEQRIDGKIAPCQNEAKLVCNQCRLVQYCCKKCQIADWKPHKGVCKSKYLKEPYTPGWTDENRIPDFMGGPPLATFGSLQYLWGNIPALDLLKAKDNEGEEKIIQQNIALLFAASGDLRNVVRTIVGLPENYAGNCTVVVNDFNTAIVARNSMLLLTAFHFEPEVAAPIMLHLWYSAMLPQAILQALQDNILPYIQDVCAKIKDKSTESMQAKTFKIGGRSLRLTLEKREWVALMTMFRVPEGLSAPEAQSIRRSITLKRIDHIDRHVYRMSPGRRVGAIDFRQHGILFPFGASRKDFTIPNPTFFNRQNSWPMKDDADPLDGWVYDEYIKCVPAAKNDIYGAFFFYLRDMLLAFCKRVRSCKISFQLLAVNAMTLPGYLNSITFDRIEVSNICDRGYVGPAVTLATFSPMLKAKSENRKATLLMLFLNAVREEESNSKDTLSPTVMAHRGRLLKKYLDIKQPILDAAMGIGGANAIQYITSPEFILVTEFLSLCGDFDLYFDQFLKSADPYNGTSMYDLARQHKMRIKSNHTIIESWPYRLTKETTKEKFKILISESTCGHERYMEFEKA